MFKNKRGFTLIELIIVMVIIGILILLAAPQFMNYLEEAKLTQIKNDTKVVEDVLLMEQGKLLGDSRDVTSIFNKDKTQEYGISKYQTKLVNMGQGKGVQINPEFIQKYINTKLNPNYFFYDKNNNLVFYHYEGKEIVEKTTNNNDKEVVIKDKEDTGKGANDSNLSENIDKENDLTQNDIIKDDNYKEANEIFEITYGNEFSIFDLIEPDYHEEEFKEIDKKLNSLLLSTKSIDSIINDEFISAIIIDLIGDDDIKSINDLTQNQYDYLYKRLSWIRNLKTDPNAIIIRSLNDEVKNDEIKEDFLYKLKHLEKNGKKIRLISSSFMSSGLYENDTKVYFPQLDHLEWIADGALYDLSFKGEFPLLKNIKYIGDRSFIFGDFKGNFPKLEKLEYIGFETFKRSKFTGRFPQLNQLEVISDSSFLHSNFNHLPKLPKLHYIGRQAFSNSSFDESIFNNYSGWNTENSWSTNL